MKISELIERYGPWVAATIVTGVYLYFFREYQLPPKVNNLYSSVVTICAVSIGFLATAKSILFAVHDSEIIRWIKRAGLYDLMINYIMTAIHLCFILAIYSAIELVFDTSWINVSPSLPFALWLFLSWVSLLSCYRVIYLLSKILRHQ